MRLPPRSSLLLFLTLTLLVSPAVQCSYSQTKMKPVQNKSDGFAVIELFTSEGCSSCPSADALMPKLKEAYGDQVIVLAFHVDYWNRLGWKDVFSSPEFTKRQYGYTSVFGTESVYTPQAVVNGKAHITGSDRAGLQKLIDPELSTHGGRAITLSAAAKGAQTVTVTYDAALERGELLNIALVQLHAITDVRRGENGGRKLPHFSVVRAFRTTSAAKGQVDLELPTGLAASGFHVIAYAQRENDRRVTGVKETPVM